MPKNVGKSVLSALAPSLAGGFQKRQGTKVTQDTGGRLPSGIMGGIAQLVEIRIAPVKEGSANAGKLQFYAAGIVKHPLQHNGTPIQGLRTSVIIPLYDTPDRTKKTASEHYNSENGVVDHLMRLMGRDVVGDETAPENVEATMAALAQAKPHFRFRTWSGNKQDVFERGGKFYVGDVDAQGKPTGNRPPKGPWSSLEAAKKGNPYAGREPMVNEVWGGVVAFSDNGEAGAVDDSTGDDVTTTPDEPVADEATEVEVTEEQTAGVTEWTDIDLPALAKLADGEGKEAEEAEQTFLRLGAEVGVEVKQIKEAPSWLAVVKMLEKARAAKGEADGTEEEEVEEVEEETEAVWEPVKGQVCDYHREVTVKDAKGKLSKRRKKIAVNPSAVNAKARSATVKVLDDGKVYKDVPFDDLRESDIPF